MVSFSGSPETVIPAPAGGRETQFLRLAVAVNGHLSVFGREHDRFSVDRDGHFACRNHEHAVQRVHGRLLGELRVELEPERVLPGRRDRLGHGGRLGADPHDGGEREAAFVEFRFELLPAAVGGRSPARRVVLDVKLGVADPERPVPVESDALRQFRRRKRQRGSRRKNQYAACRHGHLPVLRLFRVE